MEKFTIGRIYMKLCNEFRTVIRWLKVAFYRPDYQKLLICALTKSLGREFVSKHAAEPLKHQGEILKHSAELLKHSAKLLRIWKKIKSSAECLKNSAACLCYNKAHAVPISHGITPVLFERTNS